MADVNAEILEVAIAALRRRDYFVAELRSLLEERGFGPDVEPVIEHLVAKGILNDKRVAESYRLSRPGDGDAKIAAKLAARGASAELLEPGNEQERANAALVKKFGGTLDKAKAWRFLVGRGFSEETCEQVLGGIDD